MYTGWLVTHNVDQYGLELTETCLSLSLLGLGLKAYTLCSYFSGRIVWEHKQQGAITIIVIT